MQTVTLIDNPLDPTTWETVETTDARALLKERYAEWPTGARIYDSQVGEDRDVTPRVPADVDRLLEFERLFVVIYPEGPAALLIAVIAIVVVATIALMLLMPKIPSVQNQQTQSPNNGLANRTNQARPNARIPDIFGTVRSIADLLAVPYRVYENHREVEISYLCVGRGEYGIDDVRDGTTLVSEILGASAAVYGPGASPNNGATPQLQIGTAISDPVFNAAKLSEVNGQTLKAPNDNAVVTDNEARFTDAGIIEASGGAIDFTQYFTAGSTLIIGRATDTATTAAPSALFAAAKGVSPDSLHFDSFDPSAHFAVGEKLIIENAVFTNTAAPSGGDISGSVANNNYPGYPTVVSTE